MKKPWGFLFLWQATTCLVLSSPLPSLAGDFVPDPEFDEILALDISELMVTSASRREQKLNETPAAIYVITQEDLHRAGITSIPEALRMAPGIRVSQIHSHSWSVSARGFGNELSNKMLVLVDGRSIYTPVFSGTYWDDRLVMLENIERIEVIRGPGASLWGANAVNGVINIITKHSANTQGNYVSASAGNNEFAGVEARHGGKFDEQGYYRLNAEYLHRGETSLPSGGDNQDDWDRINSSFRIDRKINQRDSYMLQGRAYSGRSSTQWTLPMATAPFVQVINADDRSYGGFALANWSRTYSPDEVISFQGSLDHYTRDEAIATQHISTLDFDFQHSQALNDRHHLIWGTGYRLVSSAVDGTFTASLAESRDAIDIFSAFIQHEYALIPDTLAFTLGSKFEYNDSTGFEIQPSARFSLNLPHEQMVWGAISRAVRTPSMVDDKVDYKAASGTPVITRISGYERLHSETLIAYELGHRYQPTALFSLDSTVFWHEYDRLKTVEPNGAPFASGAALIVPTVIAELGEASAYGAEAAATWNVTKRWKLMGTYSYAQLDFRLKPGSTFSSSAEDLLPQHQFSIRSYLTLLPDVQWNNMLYYTSSLEPPVDDYLRYDTRIAWQATPNIELSLTGQNLLDPTHKEMADQEFLTSTEGEIGRSIIGRVCWKF